MARDYKFLYEATSKASAPGTVLSSAVRRRVNGDIAKKGADGTASFPSTGAGWGVVWDVLDAYAIFPNTLPQFHGARGQQTIPIAVKKEGSDEMDEIENSHLVFSWYRRESGNYEILAYVS